MKLLVFVLLLGAAPAFSDGLPLAKPESAGMSSERLERIDLWLRGITERKQAAGFVSLVARRGKVVHHQAHGTRGLSVTEPMPKDALFDLASMTKPVTVAAALMLLEEGRITLNDPVSRYLPEFEKVKVETAPGTLAAPERPITVKHLFTHTSGVYPNRSREEIYRSPTLQSFINDLVRMPLRTQPGSTWLYGTSHDVLGYLVQTVSGKPLDQFVRERILEPLKMQDTHYWPPAEKDEKRRAILVVNGADDLESRSRVPEEAGKAKTFIGGGSGLYSTAGDYWRFCQMLLNGGTLEGKRLLGPRTIEWLARDQMPGVPYRNPGTRFGLGFAVVTDAGATGQPYSDGTYYWSGSQGTLFWIDPKEQLIGVLMVQVVPERMQLRDRFSNLVYSSILE